ncbi:MAG: DUF3108 domain-containing protein [Pseudomonadales bacterium]|nr:DUF3108 domain-containing protein [Pseudomonadales bacterium]NRA15166.1 DUF3108 domain-containing protein [Oceanospirillaceae bacterium]
MSLQFLLSKSMLKRISYSALLACISLPSYALEAYQATYTANIKSGLSFSGTLKRSLSKVSDGQWLFQDNISSMLASIEESSNFTIDDNKIQPLKYHYLRKVLGKKKKRDISFDWSKETAVNRDNQSFALLSGTQDSISYQLQLQLDLQRGVRGNFSYPIAKRGAVSNIKFVQVGREVIDTPMGKLDSIKLKLDRGADAKRVTYIWFSTKHNFIISQLQQTEADGKSYSIVLKKLS